MDDLIRRQDAIDAVCMEWCGVKHQDCKHPFDVEKGDYYWCDGCESALQTLPDLPSAQPEVIHCKDCRYRELDDHYGFMCGLDTGDPYGLGRCADDENWYCADAKRRED